MTSSLFFSFYYFVKWQSDIQTHSGSRTLFFKLICLFLAALGLPCCVGAFSSCGEQGLLFFAVHGLLIAVASLVVEQGSRRMGFSSCGTRAQ